MVQQILGILHEFTKIQEFKHVKALSKHCQSTDSWDMQ